MSTAPVPPSDAAVPAYLAGLVDDAAIFPPGNAELSTAVASYQAYRVAAYAELVGPFLISDIRLPDLIRVLDAVPPADPLPVAIVVTGGAGAIEGAVRWAGGASRIDLQAIEFALRDEEDLPHNVRRVTTALDQLLADNELAETVLVSIEPPRLYGAAPTRFWLEALDEVAAMDYRLKLRTGGLDADAFPGSAEVAGWIENALDRELTFKCTAGLHRAVRHSDEQSGFEHHGFLNMLLATRAILDGAEDHDVQAILEEADAAAVAARVAAAASLESARRWFTSFGSCSILEPLGDLIDLGLLPLLEQP